MYSNFKQRCLFLTMLASMLLSTSTPSTSPLSAQPRSLPSLTGFKSSKILDVRYFPSKFVSANQWIDSSQQKLLKRRKIVTEVFFAWCENTKQLTKITLLGRLLESLPIRTSPILPGSLNLASKEAWEGSTTPLSQISTSKFQGGNKFTGDNGSSCECHLIDCNRDYGVLIEEAGIALRGLFIVDPSGVLRFGFLVFVLNLLVFNHARNCINVSMYQANVNQRLACRQKCGWNSSSD